MTKLVGLTGGIGSGKSTVCKIFNVLGIPVYKADDEAKNLYNTDPELKRLMISNFGHSIYTDGLFNRSILREQVFKDKDKLALLNSLVHPRVAAHTKEWLSRQNSQYAIKEAALLIESGVYKQLDYLITVTCPLEKRIERVMLRDRLSVEEVENRIAHQLPEDILLSHADYVVINDDDSPLIPQVMTIHSSLMSRT